MNYHTYTTIRDQARRKRMALLDLSGKWHQLGNIWTPFITIAIVNGVVKRDL